MKDFKVALFFDDSKHNFENCETIPNLIPILVKTNPKLSLDNDYVNDSDFLKEINKFIKDQKGYQNTLSKRIKRKKTKKKMSKSDSLVEFTKLSEQFNKNMYKKYKDIPITFDNTSGITTEDLKFTTSLVNKNNIGAIFFDIDNTILKVNGFPFLDMKNHNYSQDFSPEIISAFYLGGFQRMKELKRLFNALYSKNVNWYFITANPSSQKSTLKKGKGNLILLQILYISGMVSKDKRFNLFKKSKNDIVKNLEDILKNNTNPKLKSKLDSFIDEKVYYTTDKCNFIKTMIQKENIKLFVRDPKKSKKKLDKLSVFKSKRNN